MVVTTSDNRKAAFCPNSDFLQGLWKFLMSQAWRMVTASTPKRPFLFDNTNDFTLFQGSKLCQRGGTLNKRCYDVLAHSGDQRLGEALVSLA